jgi:CDP-diacylglycerol--glycerol-3-phosphate 3-phosphatidyltransferase
LTLYSLKPAFQDLLRPLASRIVRAGGTANQVTIGAMALSLAAGALAAFGGSPRQFLAIPFCLAVRMALNAIDGMMAREFCQKSRLGAYLNEIGDVVSDAALTLPFALVPGVGLWPVGAAMLLAIISEFAGVLGPAVGASRRYDGPMGKSDRALAFGALATWIGLGLPTGAVLAGLVWLIAALTAVTIVNRIRAGLSEAAASEAKQ